MANRRQLPDRREPEGLLRATPDDGFDVLCCGDRFPHPVLGRRRMDAAAAVRRRGTVPHGPHDAFVSGHFERLVYLDPPFDLLYRERA